MGGLEHDAQRLQKHFCSRGLASICQKPVHSSVLCVQMVRLELGQTMGREQGYPGPIPKMGPRWKARALALETWPQTHSDGCTSNTQFQSKF